jgi:hypothetical protein
MRPGSPCGRRRPGPGPAAAARRWPWCPGKAPGGCPPPGWPATSRARSRFSYRIRLHTGRKGERCSLSEADYAELVTAAHTQLHAAVILCWDNLNTHLSGVMRTLLQAHREWLSVIQMPAYAPDLNPVEGAWSAMKSAWATWAPAAPCISWPPS